MGIRREKGDEWAIFGAGISMHLPQKIIEGFHAFGARTDENFAARTVALPPGEDRLLLLRQLHVASPAPWLVEDWSALPVAGGILVWIERGRR